MPLHTVICSPYKEETLPRSPLVVQRYAVTDNKYRSEREGLSADAGLTLMVTNLTEDEGRLASWCSWEPNLKLDFDRPSVISEPWTKLWASNRRYLKSSVSSGLRQLCLVQNNGMIRRLKEISDRRLGRSPSTATFVPDSAKGWNMHRDVNGVGRAKKRGGSIFFVLRGNLVLLAVLAVLAAFVLPLTASERWVVLLAAAFLSGVNLALLQAFFCRGTKGIR